VRTFFDSSALAKRYVQERGSDVVQRALAEAAEAAVSLVCPLEITSALSRLFRQGLISAAQYDMAKNALFEDIEDMSVCAVSVPVVHSAIDLIERHPLRTLDALHVASALEWRADLFVSSDRRQVVAAAKSGLRVLQV
jgi:predicted nucleic acid-binding protein